MRAFVVEFAEALLDVPRHRKEHDGGCRAHLVLELRTLVRAQILRVTKLVNAAHALVFIRDSQSDLYAAANVMEHSMLCGV